MKKNIFVLSIILAVAYSCSQQQNFYKVGETFQIQLEREAAGGYQWNMKPDSLVSIVKETSVSRHNDSTNLEEYIKVYELKPEKPGTTELQFYQKRSFEPDSLVTKDQYFYKKIQIK